MSEVIANRRQPMKQQRTAVAATHHPLPDVTVDFVRQVSIDSTEQRVQQQEKQQEQQSPQKQRHDETSENNKTTSAMSKSASARAQRLSRRHSSAAIVQLPLSGPELTTPTALSGIGGRSRSSSTRAPVGRRRIPLHEQQPSTFQQQQQQQSVHWLNVPGSGATANNKNSRSAEQLERLELLLMAPTWNCSSTTVSSSHQHRHRHPSGGSKSPSGGSSGGGGGRWGDASVTNSGPSVSSGRDRLTVSPPLSSAPSPSQLRPHRQQHSRSQSVRAPVAGDGGRARKSSSTNNNNNCHGGSQKKTSTNNSGVQQQMTQPSRPRGTSLPSNRAAAAASAASAGGESSNNGQVQFGDEDETDYYLLRHFIVHGKGNKVVNRGDSFRRLRNHQQQQGSASQHSSTSSISTENVAGSPPPSHPHHHHHQQPPQQQQQQQAQYYSYSDHQSSSSSRRASLLGMAGPSAGLEQVSLLGAASGSSSSTANGPEPFRVLMLGASGVGKTALTAQFMTSEYLNTYEASLDEDSCDRSVSVLLDGEESQLIFIDHPHGEISVENCMSTYNPHAYVIVYSVVDAESLRQVEEVLHFLWRHSLTSASTPLRRGGETQSSPATTPTPPQLQLPPPPPVVILVANKIDLVRSRIISPQAGKSLATSFDCKYIETSSGMQHNVDELLVGILKQIRLKIQMTEQMFGASSTSSSSRSLFRKRSGRRRHQHRVNYQTAAGGDDGDGSATQGEGSCCITTAVTTTGYRTTASANRRSTSLRVRRMLGKAVWTCAEYYHRNKSRSCEDLHVL